MKEARLTIGERERDEIHMAWAGRHETNTRFVVGQSERHEVEVKVISGLFSAEIDVIVDGKLVFTL
jgi:hypothetical protein